MSRIPRSLVLLTALLVPILHACGDDSGPLVVDPTTPARMVLDRSTAELELRDTITLSVTAFDASGGVMRGTSVTWSSSDASVASVTTTGLVTGLAGGTARITATAGPATASADITVQGWNIADNAVVIDSMVLRLAGDSTERADGTYRFTANGTPPTLGPGDVIVGAEAGGFLRRVVSVSVAGAEIVVHTDPASLSDIIQEGSLETVLDDLVFSTGGVPSGRALRTGEVRWGAPEFHPALPGVTLDPSGVVNLTGLDICAELKKIGGASCPSGIGKLEVVTGTLDFGPQLELKASFSGLALSSFRGVAKGEVSADFDILLEAKTSATVIAPQIKIAGVTRPFYGQIGPVPVLGYVELALNGGLEAKATAKGHIQAGYTSSHSVEVGAEWRDASGWSAVFQNQRTFDAREPTLEDGTLSGQIDVTTRLFLKPEIKIIFYGVVGPFLNVEPYGKFTMTFGTSSCGMKSEAGIDSEIGFTIPFLDPKVGTLSKKNSPWFSWPGRDWTCPLGTLDVSTVTNGSSPDADGYSIVVDTLDKGGVGSNAQRVLDFIEVGDHTVRLDGIASNCSVTGSNPAAVKVSTGLVTPVAFEIDCAEPGGDLVVTMQTSGQAVDPDGYALSVDNSQTQNVGTNGTATFAGLAQGDHQLAVSGVAPNCLLVGSNPRTVLVPSGGQASVTVSVACTASQLIVATTTSGPPSSSPWSITLDGSDTRSIDANDQVTFDVSDGAHSVELKNLANNCTVQGPNPRNVTVSGQTIETFDVSCQTGGLTVSVTTTGDASPATSFTVKADTATKSVGVNGSANFAELPTGLTTVELRDLPSHCLVQDENPRQVEVPGSTAFEVLCQAPLACLTPPGAAYFDEDIVKSWDSSEPQPTMIVSVPTQLYGNLEVTSSISGMTQNQSASTYAQIGWVDWWKLIPVDQTREGEHVTLRVRVSGSLVRARDPDSLTVSESKTMGLTHRIATFNGNVVGDNYSFSEVTELDWVLGDWVGVDGYVLANPVVGPGHPGASASATAAQQVRVVDVVDASAQTVPIVQMCTASGTDYR